MIVYLDTSVVLRVLLGEPNPTNEWGKWEKAYSSAFGASKRLRTVDRLRLTHEITDIEVADLVRDVQTVNATLAIYPLNDRILQRASETFPDRGRNSRRYPFGIGYLHPRGSRH